MARELNFRVWDEKNGRMIYPEDRIEKWDKVGTIDVLHEDFIVVDTSGGVYVIGDCREGNEQLGGLLSLQNTGLIDKNEKEIYEGDILGIRGMKQTWIVEWDDYFAGFSPFIDGMHEGVKQMTSEPIEIIGNKFENPKLVIKYNL